MDTARDTPTHPNSSGEAAPRIRASIGSNGAPPQPPTATTTTATTAALASSVTRPPYSSLLPSRPNGGVPSSTPSVPSAAATTTASNALATTRNSATQRKVAKLLDITTSSEIKDLASYVDEILPGYFYTVNGAENEKEKDSATASMGSSSTNDLAQPQQQHHLTTGFGASSFTKGTQKAITSTALRSALDHRAIDMHKSFLNTFQNVYQNYQRVAAQVEELQSKCTELEDTLHASSNDADAAAAAEEFFYQIQTYQAELQLARHHEKEVSEFRKQHHFGPAEQQALEEGPVDMSFLTVLERAREVHRRSSELMQSQEYHQGAAAVMESTYAAIARATEKIARYLLATAGNAVAGENGGGAASAAGSVAADIPEITGFQLRCVRMLYEENPSLHEEFLDEVARLRRASVLRRYFHLLTTGSANTASGLYQSGGHVSSSAAADDAHGMGERPLEAELNNPTYFFSSLCAWLHQTIVEEQDFLHNFFVNDEADVAANSGTGKSNADTIVRDRAAQDTARQQALLDTVFGGVCKHIRAALDNVLERLGRTASALGAAATEGGPDTPAGKVEGTAAGEAAHAAAPTATTPTKGLRGLTGGLTRLIMAATGRTPANAFRRRSNTDGSNALLQRYAAVTTRSQQEAVAASLLSPPLQGIQTCVTLVQLFEYYSFTTFTPLLGTTAELTRLIREVAPQQTRDLFQRLLRVLQAHLLDSTSGVIIRTATLQRLASSNALHHAAHADEATAETAGAVEPAGASMPTGTASTYILDFLVSLTYGDGADTATSVSRGGTPMSAVLATTNNTNADFGASASSVSLSAYTANAKFRQANDGQLQRHSAQDLKRVLTQLILPPSPEISAYCGLLHAVLRDMARQADLLQAIAEQQEQQQQAGRTTHGFATQHAATATSAKHTEAREFVRDLLEALWRAAQSVQENASLRSSLDDPCRAILQYNIVYQLQEILGQHQEVLELFAQTTDAAAPANTAGAKTAAAAADDDEGELLRATLETLRADSSAAVNELRRRLLSYWEGAVVHFYFPLSANAVVAAAAAANASAASPASTSGSPSASGGTKEDQQQMAAKREVRRLLKQFVNVYNTVASMGRLPEPVPLLPALCGCEELQQEVNVAVTKCVVERVYPAQFAALQRLPPNEELSAVQEEMSPQNLVALVDMRTSPAPQSALM